MKSRKCMRLICSRRHFHIETTREVAKSAMRLAGRSDRRDISPAASYSACIRWLSDMSRLYFSSLLFSSPLLSSPLLFCSWTIAVLAFPLSTSFAGKSFRWGRASMATFCGRRLFLRGVAPFAKNNDSLVLRLHFGSETFLLPGDAEKNGWNAKFYRRTARRTLPIYGVEDWPSTEARIRPCRNFLAAVQSRVGIISAGEGNPYGHPTLNFSNDWRMRACASCGQTKMAPYMF